MCSSRREFHSPATIFPAEMHSHCYNFDFIWDVSAASRSARRLERRLADSCWMFVSVDVLNCETPAEIILRLRL